jgi:hypothetical protein
VADFNITVSNSLNIFGPAPSNKWNVHNWNAFLWGEGTTDLIASVGKFISNSLASDSAVEKLPVRVITNSLTLTGDMSSQGLKDSAGYSYVFPDRTTDGEERDFPTWTEGAGQSTTWTTASATTSSWS